MSIKDDFLKIYVEEWGSDTPHEYINGHICMYCTSEMKQYNYGCYHHNTAKTVLYCDCKDTKRFAEYSVRNEKLKDSFDDILKHNHEKLNHLRFKNEVRKLVNKYSIKVKLKDFFK